MSNDNELEPVDLDLNIIKEKVPQYTSEKLCEMIVCDRYFGFNQQIAIICMEELSNRRLNGNEFAFEDYIEKCMADLPPLNFNIPNLRDVLHQAIKIK